MMRYLEDEPIERDGQVSGFSVGAAELRAAALHRLIESDLLGLAGWRNRLRRMMFWFAHRRQLLLLGFCNIWRKGYIYWRRGAWAGTGKRRRDTTTLF